MKAAGDVTNELGKKGLNVANEALKNAGMGKAAEALNRVGGSALNSATEAIKNGENPLHAVGETVKNEG